MTLFPRCGIDMEDVTRIAAIATNKRDAARRLGISERQFYSVIKEQGLGHLFNRRRPRKHCLSADDIRQLARDGYTKLDAAFIAGVSYHYMKDLVKLYGLRDEFPTTGKASWIARRGYAK